MPKNMRWIQPLIDSFYIALQSLFWLNVVYFVYVRIEAPHLSEGALSWLILSVWVILIPISKLSSTQKTIWFFITFIAGCVVGYLLFADIATVIILLVGVIFLSAKKILDGIGAKQFVTSLMSIMIVFGVFFLLSYFISIHQEEISSLVQFLILAFIISMVGVMLAQLTHNDDDITKGFIKNWGVYIGWIWMMLALIALGSIGILFGLSVIYPLVLWLLKMLIYPVLLLVTEVILPWLQEGLARLMMEAPETDESDLIWQQDDVNLPDTLQGLSPMATLIFNIVLYSILFAVVTFIAYKFYKYIRNQFENKKAVDSNLHKRENAIKVQALDLSSDHPSTLWDKLRGMFRPYSDREEHLIRKQFRDMLKLMKKKGLWQSEAMTVQQLNQIVHASNTSSSLYERLRYGDQELSKDEIEFYREEIQKVINELKN